MTEATKSVTKRDVKGSEKSITYDITNLANNETITTPFRKITGFFGTNRITADKPFAATVSGGELTAKVSTTTDEYRVTVFGV